ncbi:unnamed protein product [Lymnaea stagnalis]|uniref:Uncharacterized protein n=1 Tax=Lymnaea stagnalis TaxID=6523 RepID=A0AAV2H1L2_LYMST
MNFQFKEKIMTFNQVIIVLMLTPFVLPWSRCSFLVYSQEWSWRGGDESADQLAKQNQPGGRSGSSVWGQSQNGNVLIFGGSGFSDLSTDKPHLLNDVWLFSLKTSNFELHHAGTLTSISTTDTLQQIVPEGRKHAAMCGFKDVVYVFGGISTSRDSLSDLWSYNLNLKTWSKLLDNISHNSSAPSARGHSAVWCYKSSMYIFGGINDKTVFNDMWSFNLLTMEWKELYRMTHSSETVETDGNTYPMMRNGAATWVSDDTFYMFGGNTYSEFSYVLQQNIGLTSDLWKYNPGSNTWQLVHGPALPGQHSVLNDIGTTVSSNIPGSRMGAASWVDSKGHLWLFGGAGLDVSPITSYHSTKLLADVWRFHIGAQGWAFMGGSKVGDIVGMYKSLNEQKHTSYPGARTEVMAWKGLHDVFYVLGGLGHDGKGYDGHLNDLWSVDCSNTVSMEHLITPQSLFLFVGLGTTTLFLVMAIMLCTRRRWDGTGTDSKVLQGHNYNLLKNGDIDEI